VSVAIDRTSYAVGDEILISATNLTVGDITVDLVCDVVVEGLRDDDWRDVYKPECNSLHAATLKRRESATGRLAFAPGAPGELAAYDRFRLRITVHVGATTYPAYSRAFTARQ